METNLKFSIVRVWGKRGIVGAAFLVNPRTILTCTHVVNEAIGRLSNSFDAPKKNTLVKVDFPLVDPEVVVETRIKGWHLTNAGKTVDIAELDVIGELPLGANPPRLIASNNLWGHPFRAFGFPREIDKGVWVSGRIMGRDASGWVQIEDVKQTGYFVQPGFSGTPVWDDMLDGVVGMVVNADVTPGVRAAFIIPIDLIVKEGIDIDFIVDTSIQKKLDYNQVLSQEDSRLANLLTLLGTEHQKKSIFQAPPRNDKFVGRITALKKITHRLTYRAPKHVIIHGIGGIGKTSLAIQLAHSLRTEFSDGVLWANMRASDAIDVINAFGYSLGADFSQVSGLENRASNLRGIMSGKKYLMVLDDVQPDSEIEYLIPGSDTVGVIITTRVSHLPKKYPLQLANALNISIDALSREDAYTFMISILGADFVKQNRDTVLEIIDLLGGMPLALEIAASKLLTETESPTEYLEMLKNQMKAALLLDKRRGVFASLDISWHSLDSNQQSFLSSLDVFGSNEFCLDAVVAVTNTPLETSIDVIDTLISLSLLKETHSFCYRFHPLIANYLSTKASTNERRFIRLAGYYLKFVRAVDERFNKNEYACILDLDRELPNVRRVMNWALNSSSQVARETLIGLTVSISHYLHLRSRWQDSLKWNLAAMEKLSENDDPIVRSIIQNNIGYAYLKLGSYEKALVYLNESQNEQVSDEDVKAMSLLYAGIVYRRLGDYDAALAAFNECLSYYQENEDYNLVGYCLLNIGIVWRRRGEYDMALNALHNAIENFEQVGNKKGLAFCYGNIGNAMQRQGKFEEALSNHLRALQIRKEIDDVQGQADSLGNLGTTYRDMGDFEKALDMYYQSLTVRKDLGLKWEVANSQRGIGLTYLELALDALEKRRSILKDGNNYRELKKVEILINTIRKAIDDYLPYRRKRQLDDDK